MELNFRRFFILRSSDYSNTKSYLKISHPTANARVGGGGVVKHHLSMGNVLSVFKVPGFLKSNDIMHQGCRKVDISGGGGGALIFIYCCSQTVKTIDFKI